MSGNGCGGLDGVQNVGCSVGGWGERRGMAAEEAVCMGSNRYKDRARPGLRFVSARSPWKCLVKLDQ